MLNIKLSICVLIYKLCIPILPNGVHAGFLADGVNVCARHALGSRHKLLQVDLLGEIHLSRDSREDETLLTPDEHNIV